MLKENIDTFEEFVVDGLGEVLDRLMLYSGDTLVDEDIEVGEYGAGDIAREFFGEVAGDFKLIKDGDVFFLKFLIAGD